jgi:hypothetical protein
MPQFLSSLVQKKDFYLLEVYVLTSTACGAYRDIFMKIPT